MDPRDESWFYVGKGTGRRMRRHFSPSALEKDTYKVRKIRSIREDGREPYGEKLVEDINEELAYFVEGELIDKHYDDLTNYCRAGEPRWSDGMPEEIRQKIKERTPSPKGRTMPEAAKRKIAEAQQGTSAPNVKLSRREAQEIKWYVREPDVRVNQRALADEYDVSPVTVTSIKTGHSWSHVDPKEPEQIPKQLRESDGRLRKEEAAEIKWLAQEEYNQRQIEEEYGVGTGAVSPIKNEENWADVEPRAPESIPDHFDKTYTQLSQQEAAEAKWLLENGYRRTGIGEIYDVSPEYIWNIKVGESRPGLESREPKDIPDWLDKPYLTEKEAGEIKYLALHGEPSQPEIAEMYDVAQSQVSRIKRGKRWPDVEPKEIG